MSTSAEQAKALIGHWALVSWTGETDDGATVAHGGDYPLGDLIYLDSGRMAVQIQSDGRDPFGSTDREAGTPTERAIAYSTYNAYCGTFTVPQPGVVVHRVELSIHPDQVGMDKRREFELDGDELTLRTQPLAVDGGTATSELRWRRR